MRCHSITGAAEEPKKPRCSAGASAPRGNIPLLLMRILYKDQRQPASVAATRKQLAEANNGQTRSTRTAQPHVALEIVHAQIIDAASANIESQPSGQQGECGRAFHESEFDIRALAVTARTDGATVELPLMAATTSRLAQLRRKMPSLLWSEGERGRRVD